MKTPTTILAVLVSLAALSQPGFPDEVHEPCGFAPDDSLDVTGDGVPDFVIAGFRTGTDDEPSSSGTCQLYVANLPGTGLLSARDSQGHRSTTVFAKGDTIPPLSIRPQDDFQLPKLAFVDGQVRVAYWGYGHQSSTLISDPRLAEQRYVFETHGSDQTWHGCFTVEPPTASKSTRLHVIGLFPADKLMIVP
ncbi:MAG: hypothetical protein JNM62_13785 [Flavobacteriales bacterium]|nr:hypothetical protein [Flavobacteriales bacterium]